MPLGVDGQQYQDEFHAIYSQVDGPTHITVHPSTSLSEGSGDQLNSPGTPVPVPENNASAGSTIDSRGIVDKLLGNDGERYQLWPERMVRSALSAAGDALQGKTPDWAIDAEGNVNTSIQTIEKAQDLANLAVLGPAPVAAKLADGTLGSFAGVRSKILDKGALEVAQAAEKEGIKPDEIWQKTGFFRGADQRWRYEIDDSSLKYSPEKLRENVNMPLDHVLDHPELFKAYPELKDIKVHYDPMSKGASFDKRSNTINLDTRYKDRPDILMHEVQHAIQGHEGFAAGGTPGKNVRDYTLKYEEEFQKTREEFHNLWKKANDPNKGYFDALTPEENARYDFLQHVVRTYNKYAKAGDNKAIENYMKLAGETEARNVETRLLLNPMQRSRYSPKTTQDYPDLEQIVSDYPIYTTPYSKP